MGVAITACARLKRSTIRATSSPSTVRFQQGSGGTSLSATVPFTWALNDAISLFVMYPAA
jgi:hypothetical protein